MLHNVKSVVSHNFRPMRLIRRSRRVGLDRPDDSVTITSDEKDGARVGGRERAALPLPGAIERERGEKTHRRARFNRVDKELSERLEIRVGHRRGQSLDRGR